MKAFTKQPASFSTYNRYPTESIPGNRIQNPEKQKPAITFPSPFQIQLPRLYKNAVPCSLSQQP